MIIVASIVLSVFHPGRCFEKTSAARHGEMQFVSSDVSAVVSAEHVGSKEARGV